MAKPLLTDKEWVLDKGDPLWPAREPPSDKDRWVWESIAMLTDRQREIVEAYHYERLSFDKIGKRLGISKQAVHKMYNRALERMRERGAP